MSNKKGRRQKEEGRSVRLLIAFGWLLGPVVCPAQGDPTAASAIVGFQRVTLAEGWHALGPPLEPFPAAQGQVSGLQPHQLSVAQSADATAWQPDQWRGYEVRMASGNAAGRRYVVVGNGADWLAVSADLIAEGIAVGDAVSILPALEDYLGKQTTGDDTVNGADWVATYLNDSLVRLHCTKAGLWADDANQPVRLSVVSGAGFLINLLPVNGGPRSLLLTGQWQGDLGGSAITTGRQLISIPLTGTPQTLGTLVAPSAAGQGPVAAAQPDASDQLGVWDETAGAFRPCWLDGGAGYWRWQDTGDDASGLVLEAGRGFLYRHVGQGFYLRWR